jgi:hypothetical protein
MGIDGQELPLVMPSGAPQQTKLHLQRFGLRDRAGIEKIVNGRVAGDEREAGVGSR